MIKNKVILYAVAGMLFVSGHQLIRPQAPQLQQRSMPYRLRPSDQLQLTYRYTPEYDESLTLQPDGEINLKLVGPINIGGLTLSQAQNAIRDKLATRLNAPEVSIVLTDFVKPSFVVMGQVYSPGKYDLRGDLTAMDAIAAAGGFKDSAKTSQVVLYRQVSANDYVKVGVLDLKKFMNPKHPDYEANAAVEPGDLLVVPKSSVAKFTDYVHWVNVGTYILLF